MPDLEDRVAALEAALTPWHPEESWTDEQIAAFKEQFAEAAKRPYDLRCISSPPPLSPEQVRQLLGECVTVVKPGETLIVQVPMDTPPRNVGELQWVLNEITADREMGFGVLVVPGDELGVAEEPDFMSQVQAESLHGTNHLTVRLTHLPTGTVVVARDRTEGVYKLRKALADRARREYNLQEKQRRAERRTARESAEAPGGA